MHHEDVVGARVLDDALEEPLGNHRAGGVVGVVEVHELRAPGHLLVDGGQVGDEAMLGLQRHQHRLRARQPRPARVHRIAGIRGQGVVARVQEGQVEVEDRLLGADRGHDLALGVQAHVEAPLIEVAHGGAEVLAPTVARVAMGLGLADGLLHRLDDQRRRRPVGVADAEADHVDSRRALLGDLALQLRERIRRDAL